MIQFCKKRKFLCGLVVGGVITAFLSLMTAEMVERTGGEEFCTSCHEMSVFGETWKEGFHGTMKDGIVVAQCTDCHLPHDNVVHYMTEKAKSGMKDVSSHLLNKTPDWIENLEHREEFTFESGCTKCHVELVAPGISRKAYRAHRDYITGETKETCISCHTDAGHHELKKKLKKIQAISAKKISESVSKGE